LYVDLKYEPEKNDLICEFRIEPSKGFSIEKAAESIAAESSIGTWTEVKTMNDRIRELGAKVFEIKGNNVKIAYPLELFEPCNMPQILSSIAGNIFGMKVVKNLKLEDVCFPEELVKSFKGPLYGIKGIRNLLKIPERPLCGTIVKPKLGLSEEEHAKVAYEAWLGGIDIVKDDENLSNLSFNHFSKRVIETLKMRDKAEKETGEKKMYMPNITAELDTMLERANFVKSASGEYAMIDIISIGWSALETLRNANEELKLVLHAHRAGHAIYTRGKHGVSMLVLAKISRIIGVDQLHTGTANIGKMECGENETKKINLFLQSDYFNMKKVFPVSSGGLHPGLIPEIIKTLGKNVICQFGGGIHGHPLGTRAGAKAVRQAIDAVMNDIPLKEYSKKNKELKLALETWK
jgi:ribulose-bisphosphate carboxylase large chain